MTTIKLPGCQILLIRPRGATPQLTDRLLALGATVSHYPVMTINSLVELARDSLLTEITTFDKAIFVSRNAAIEAVKLCSDPALEAIKLCSDPALAQLDSFAIGKETARYLDQSGIKAVVPTEQQTSEGLLALPALHNVMGDNIVIFSGRGGRRLLSQQLTQRGANVSLCELYERNIEHGYQKPINLFLATTQEPLVMIHSGELLDNLLHNLNEENKIRLQQLPVVVPGERVAELCRQKGLCNAVIAKSALPEDMVSAAQEWYSKSY